MTVLLATTLSPADELAWREALSRALPDETFIGLLDAVAGAPVDVAIVANPPVGSLAGRADLRLIQSLWAGVDRLLDDTSLPAGVPIARMVDPAMNRAMAETALWAVLSLHRDHFAYALQQRQHQWRQLPQRRADEVRVLVLGLGQMGATVARTLLGAGYRVSGWSTRLAQLDGIDCHAGEAALTPLLGAADVLVNLLPLTPVTRGFFDAAMFSRLRRGAGFINLARGAHVVEADLLAALEAGQVGHAVLDVFATEPLPPEHAFWSHPRVTVLPHAAAETDLRSAAGVAAANVRALREGRPLANLVDRSRGY